MYFEMTRNCDKKCLELPTLSKEGFEIKADPEAVKRQQFPADSAIVNDLNSTWDIAKFMTPRIPVSVGTLSADELERFSRCGATRVLDLPIKFPGSDFRIPKELEQFKEAIQRIVDFEKAVNPDRYDEYYCYLTVDQGIVQPGTLQRESPCHVDGLQGARWQEKLPINHTYTVGTALPTRFYAQPFDLRDLDEAKHNFYWEMDRQVALTGDKHVYQPQPGEITMMDAYTVHRGAVAEEPTPRTWIRLSFEVRQFDRLGNAHNPMFNYNWKMVPRDVEDLNLSRYVPGEESTVEDGELPPSMQQFREAALAEAALH